MNALRAAIVHGARRTARRGEGVRSARLGDGYEFAQLRGYVEGDDPRRIDWAASARTGAMQTRVYLEETALVLAAIVDESPSMRVGRTRRLSDAADDAVRAWFGAAEHEDRAARLVDDRLVTERRAAMHVRAREPFSLERTLKLALRLVPRGASLLLVTDAYDLPDYDEGSVLLSRLAARCDATALIARDPWTDGLPLRGFHRLRDAESGRTRLVYVGKRARARFHTSVEARAVAIRERFVSAGWRTGVLDERDGRRSLERTFGV